MWHLQCWSVGSTWNAAGWGTETGGYFTPAPLPEWRQAMTQKWIEVQHLNATLSLNCVLKLGWQSTAVFNFFPRLLCTRLELHKCTSYKMCCETITWWTHETRVHSAPNVFCLYTPTPWAPNSEGLNQHSVERDCSLWSPIRARCVCLLQIHGKKLWTVCCVQGPGGRIFPVRLCVWTGVLGYVA